VFLMSRYVCFIDDEDGQHGLCLNEVSFIKDCKTCKMNPFPKGIVPDDRILRRENMSPCEYELMSDREYNGMIKGRVDHYPHRTRGRHQAMKAVHKTSAYAFEYELISAEDWAKMTVGEHRFPRSAARRLQRGRGFTRLRFSLRNPRRR